MASGGGGRFEGTFYDVRVFNPYAHSNRHSTLSARYQKHENIKKRAFEQQIIEVEHSTFTPIVLPLIGGLGNAATICYKRLASLLSTKLDQPYGKIMT